MRKHSINESFFREIDSETKAYWLGFLTADGAIHKNHLRVMLAAVDAEHLRRMVSDMGGDYPVVVKEYKSRQGFPAANVQIGSQRIVRDLALLGVGEKKSFTVRPCSLIPGLLLRHYWRGVVDGDGHLTLRSHGRHKRQWCIGMLGSQYMARGFSEFVADRVETNARVRPYRNIYSVRYSGNRIAPEVIGLLYADSSVSLPRKQELANQAMEVVECLS